MPMTTPTLSARLTLWFRARVAQGGLCREAILPLVGLLVIFGLLRPPVPAQDLSWRALAFAALVLLVLLLLLGAAVNLGQPVFRALGQLSGGLLGALAGVALWWLLRHKGARYLAQWEAAH